MRRTETPKPIWIKFCTVVYIPDVVTYTNFGDHRLRRFWVAGGQISPSPIDFHRRPYNTLALPSERVVSRKQRRCGTSLARTPKPVSSLDFHSLPLDSRDDLVVSSSPFFLRRLPIGSSVHMLAELLYCVHARRLRKGERVASRPLRRSPLRRRRYPSSSLFFL